MGGAINNSLKSKVTYGIGCSARFHLTQTFNEVGCCQSLALCVHLGTRPTAVRSVKNWVFRTSDMYTSYVLMSPTVAILAVEMSECGQYCQQNGEEVLLTFPAAICASKPPAIDLAVKRDPPLFGAYHTEPGCCGHKLLDELWIRRLVTHVVRSCTIVENP